MAVFLVMNSSLPSPQSSGASPAEVARQRNLFLPEVPSSVSICTLADDALKTALEQDSRFKGIMIAPLHTENLGIEHVIVHCLQNPHVRFILLCGEDGQQAIGHLPGQSFLALAENGMDAEGRIPGARGKRPILANMTVEAVAYFRENVTLVDKIEERNLDVLYQTVEECLKENRGPAKAFEGEQPLLSHGVVTLPGFLPERLSCDPAGYFIIQPDREAGQLVLEHYQTSGVLATVIHGKTGPEVYHMAIECGLLSRMDHAAYLGRELQRAEAALLSGEDYTQDAQHGVD